MPLSARISSAFGRGRALAPSTRSARSMRPALSSWIMPPSAAGMSTLALECEQLVGRDRLAAVELARACRPRPRASASASASMPVLGVDRAVRVGDADDRARRAGRRIRAAQRADVAEALDARRACSAGFRPSCRRRLAEACRRRRGRWPPRARSEPSSATGLPVTIAGVWPCSLPYSSIIQAITWALVPTSGAGMSRCRAEDLLDLVDERARDLLQLVASSSLGVAVDAALGAAERDVHDRRLPRHQRGERAHLVEVDLGVVADAALVRSARAVVLDAEAGEDVDLARRRADRDLHLDLAVRGPHDRARCRRGISSRSAARSNQWLTIS